MNNNKRKKRQIKLNKVYLVDSFAGVKVKIKAVRKETCTITKEDAWYGVLIDEEDAKALHEHGVPYSRINIDESIIFEWQIVKSIRHSSKGVTKDERVKRKHKHKRKNNSNTV